MGVLDDRQELGRRVRAARAYTDEPQDVFGKRIGRSDKTLAKIEHGDASAIPGSAEERHQLLALIASSTGCPPEILGLTALQPDEAAELRAAVGALARLVTEPALDEPARQLIEAELDVARQWSTSSPRFGEQENEAESR